MAGSGFGLRRGMTSGFALIAGKLLVGLAVAGHAGEPPRLEFLPSGLRVGTTAPEGWSHLIVKSLPRVASGDLGTLPRFAKRSATRFRTVIVLDRQLDSGSTRRFALRRIGMGLCVPLSAGDLTTSPGSPEALEALGVIDRQVLEQADQVLKQARLLVATPRLCLLRAPSVQRIGGSHVDVDVHYVFLIEPENGAVTTLVWSLPRDTSPIRGPTSLRRLPANLIYDCEIDVAAMRVLGAVPVHWSFAMNDLPPGEPIRIDREAASWIERPSRILYDPVGFERMIQPWIKARPSGTP
ncbi:MAG: hypothetical protein AB7I30_20035 [Isosphaeraceae bacterium]